MKRRKRKGTRCMMKIPVAATHLVVVFMVLDKPYIFNSSQLYFSSLSFPWYYKGWINANKDVQPLGECKKPRHCCRYSRNFHHFIYPLAGVSQPRGSCLTNSTAKLQNNLM